MAFSLKHQLFNTFLDELSQKYRIFGPVLMAGKGKHSDTDVIGYGEINSLE